MVNIVDRRLMSLPDPCDYRVLYVHGFSVQLVRLLFGASNLSVGVSTAGRRNGGGVAAVAPLCKGHSAHTGNGRTYRASG